MRRVCSSGWLRRWRGVLWCSICLVSLAILAIWDSLGYLLTSTDNHRTRHCPPPPVEVDGCASWRPLQVPHPTCGCTRKLLVLHDTCSDFMATDAASYLTYTREYYGNSECSDQATLRGPRQHVVSLSVEQMTSDDLSALNRTINQVNSAYKGWVIRAYASAKNHNHTTLCSLVCDNPNLDLCDVSHMPQPPPSSYSQGRMGWRWAILGDPLVSVWLVRYLELEVLAREAHAVTQFINSDKCWHLMKDHKSHAKQAIGSGLLGGKTAWGSTELQHIRQRLTHQIRSISDEETILEEALLPLMGHDVMTHDSVSCQDSLESVPYPSRRNPGQWVGMPAYHVQSGELLTRARRDSAIAESMNTTQTNSLLLKRMSKDLNSSSTKPRSKFLVPSKPPRDQKNLNRQAKHEGPTSNSAPKSPMNNMSQSTTESKKEQMMTKDYILPMDLATEEKINEKNGIIICPPACRPHLHPNWQYC